MRHPVPAATRMGAVHLTVADLDHSLDWYARVVGLEELQREDERAALGPAGGEELLVLVEEPGARPAHGYTGLFHFALRVPERIDLARWLAHAARGRVPLTGLSDHYVSEAIYLHDPDGHGIEIYADRDRALWEGLVSQRLTTFPLDIDSLLGLLDDSETGEFGGLPAGTTMGHVHFKVADVPAAVAFYRGELGFELMAAMGDVAAFLAAGGYHHHVGANSWESRDAPPPPPGTAALRCATVVLPDAAARDELAGRLDGVEEIDEGPLVRDPSGNALLLVAAETT